MRVAQPSVALLLATFAAWGCHDVPDTAQTAVLKGLEVDGATECVRLEPRRTGVQISLTRPERYPCAVAAVPTGVVLRGSGSGAHPDPDGEFTQVVRDGRGRYYTTAALEPVVLAWSPAGEYLGTLGRAGRGPGEFASWPLALWIDDADSLYVRDASGRWLVFDPDWQFVRMFSGGGMTGAPVTHLTHDHTLIHTRHVPGGARGAAFHVTDLEGELIRSVAARDSSATELAGFPRASGYDGENEVWIAPPDGTRGLILERWNLDGELLNVVTYDAPWLPLDGYASNRERVPRFSLISVDRMGLAWVFLSVRDARWEPLAAGQHPDDADALRRRYDFRLEVIDPAAAALLASVRFDWIDPNNTPPVMPVQSSGAGDRLTFAVTRDSVGVPSIHIYRLLLTQNESQP